MTSIANLTPLSSNILNLPTEIRTEILFYVFVSRGAISPPSGRRASPPAIRCSPPSRQDKFWGRRRMVDILVLNKKIHDEAFHVLFTGFVFTVMLHSISENRPGYPHLEMVSVRGRALVRSLRVEVFLGPCIRRPSDLYAAEAERLLAGFRELRQLFPSVQNICIVSCRRCSCYEDGRVEYFGLFKRMPWPIEGIKRVEFECGLRPRH